MIACVHCVPSLCRLFSWPSTTWLGPFQRSHFLRKDRRPACRPRADRTQFVGSRTEQDRAPASPTMWVTRTKVAVLNAYWTQTAHRTAPVYATGVRILALARVGRTPTARWWITCRLALVGRATPAIHSDTAAFNHRNVSTCQSIGMYV